MKDPAAPHRSQARGGTLRRGLGRGRRLGDAVSSADFALVLAEGPLPPWPHRRIRWPDY